MTHLSLFRRFRLAWLIIVCLALSACAIGWPKVSYDFDASVDFTALKQFAWAEPDAIRRSGDPLADNSLVDDRIKSVIEHQLQQKGIQPACAHAPDFLVSYWLVTKKHSMAWPSAYPYSPFYGYGMGFGYSRGSMYYGNWGMSNTYWEEYETHDLVVDFLHPVTRKQLWRAVLQNAVDLTGDPAAQKYQLDSKLQYVFRNFPPGSAPSNQR